MKAGTAAKILPRLQSISVSSLYGVESDLWYRFGVHCYRNKAQTVYACTEMFDQFLQTSNVNHLCVRDQNGPLQISSMSRGQYSRTVHFEPNPLRVPLILGSPVRFVSAFGPNENYREILQRIGTAIDLSRSVRSQMPGQGSDSRTAIDIYCSTSVNLPPTTTLAPGRFNLASSIPAGSGKILIADAQRRIASKAGEKLQTLLRESSGVKDIVRFHPSADIEVCVACGSGAPA